VDRAETPAVEPLLERAAVVAQLRETARDLARVGGVAPERTRGAHAHGGLRERASRGATATWRSSARRESGAELDRETDALEAFANPKKIADERRASLRAACPQRLQQPRRSAARMVAWSRSEGASRTLARADAGFTTREVSAESTHGGAQEEG